MSNPDSPFPTADSEQRRKGNARLITAVCCLASIVAASFYLFLAFQMNAWQLFALSLDIWGLAIALLAGLLLTRRDQVDLGIGVTLVAAQVTFAIASVLISEVGLTLGLGIAVLVALIGAQTLTGRRAEQALLSGLITGTLIVSLDTLGLEYRLPAPAVIKIFLPLIIAAVVFIFGYSFLRVFRHFRLQARLTALVLLATIPLLAGIATYIVFQTEAIVGEQANQVLGRSDQALATNVSTWLDLHIRSLQELAALPDIISMDPARQESVLKAMAAAYPNLYLIHTTDLNGLDVARNDGGPLTDYHDRQWFVGGQSGAPVTLEVLIDQTTGKPALSMAAPIRNVSGQIVGVASIVSQLDEISREVLDITLGRDGYAYIVDTNNRVVAHPDPTFTTKELHDLSTYAPVMALRQGTRGSLTFTDDAGLRWRAYLGTLDNGWGIIAQQPEAELLEPLQLFRRVTVTVVAVGLALILVLTWLTIRSSLKPISELTESAAALAAGDLNRVIEVKSHDEVGTLAQTFNNMTGELRDLFSSLEVRVAERTRELADSQAHTQILLSELREASRIARLANFEIDLASQTLVFSDQFYELVGTTAEVGGGYRQPIDQGIQRFVHPEDAGRVMNEVQALLSSSEAGVRQLEYRLIRADGETRTMSFRFQVERDTDGNPLRAKGAVQDITERQRAEEEMAKFKLALERSSEAIFITDTAGCITYINAAFEKVYGYTKSEALGQTPRILKSGLLSAEAYAHFWGTLLAKGTVAGEITNKTKDGRLVNIEGSNNPILDKAGNVIGFMAIHRDVTERHQTQQTLAKRAAELETVTRLATSIATIQNPQAMLQSVVDLVKPSFGLYHAHIYLLNEAGDTLVLAAGAGEAGRAMVTQRRAIPLSREQSLVARAARTRQGVIANDVANEPDFLPHALLPDTRSELAVPLIVGETVLGVLDVQSDQVGHFTAEDVHVQTILATQIATALQNTRLLAQTEATLRERDVLNRRLTRQGWETYLGQSTAGHLGFVYDDDRLLPLAEAGQAPPTTDSAIVRPILVHGEAIGQVVAADGANLNQEVAAVIDAVADQLSAHLENLRLTEEVQTALANTEALYGFTAQLNAAATLDEVVRAACALDQARGGTLFKFELNAAGQPEQLVPAAIWPADLPANQMLPVGTRLPVSQFSVARHMLANPGAPVLVGDLEQDSRIDLATLTFFRQMGARALALTPLTVGGQWVGLLAISWSTVRSFGERDAERYKAFADQAAIAVNNLLLFEQAQRRANRERLINDITRKIQGTTQVDSALQTAIQELGQALNARRASVALAVETPAAPGNGQAGSDRVKPVGS